MYSLKDIKTFLAMVATRLNIGDIIVWLITIKLPKLHINENKAGINHNLEFHSQTIFKACVHLGCLKNIMLQKIYNVASEHHPYFDATRSIVHYG